MVLSTVSFIIFFSLKHLNNFVIAFSFRSTTMNQQRAYLEQKDETEKMKAVKLNCNDVLLGRGNFTKLWSGNIFYRSLIDTKKYDYVIADSTQKKDITSEILETMERLSPSGRFLAQSTETNAWYEVDEKKAIMKIRQALREDARHILKEITPTSNTSNGSVYDDKECMQFLKSVSLTVK